MIFKNLGVVWYSVEKSPIGSQKLDQTGSSKTTESNISDTHIKRVQNNINKNKEERKKNRLSADLIRMRKFQINPILLFKPSESEGIKTGELNVKRFSMIYCLRISTENIK